MESSFSQSFRDRSCLSFFIGIMFFLNSNVLLADNPALRAIQDAKETYEEGLRIKAAEQSQWGRVRNFSIGINELINAHSSHLSLLEYAQQSPIPLMKLGLGSSLLNQLAQDQNGRVQRLANVSKAEYEGINKNDNMMFVFDQGPAFLGALKNGQNPEELDLKTYLIQQISASIVLEYSHLPVAERVSALKAATNPDALSTIYAALESTKIGGEKFVTDSYIVVNGVSAVLADAIQLLTGEENPAFPTIGIERPSKKDWDRTRSTFNTLLLATLFVAPEKQATCFNLNFSRRELVLAAPSNDF